MTEEMREMAIRSVTEMLKVTPFQVEFKVAKRPKGIKVIIEVTKEQMDATMDELQKPKI